MTISTKDFEKLLTDNNAKQPDFFAYLDKKSENGLTAKEYQSFAVNFIARTLFTVPEVAASTYRAATDLRMTGVSLGAKTLFEEAGKNPEQNHAALLVKAINYHGTSVYGQKYEPINPKEIMDLFKLLYDSGNVASIKQIAGDIDKSKFVARIVSAKEKAIDQRFCFTHHMDNSLLDACSQAVRGYKITRPPADAESIEMDKRHQEYSERPNGSSWTDEERKALRQIINRREEKILEYQDENKDYINMTRTALMLAKKGVCPEVINYGIDQLQIMDSEAKGKLAGCAFAHEGLADNMMFHIFKILYADVKKYKGGEDEFNREVYPYFSAHGDYKTMAKGEIEVNKGKGVEDIHASREIEKISELLHDYDTVAQNAYDGAKEFIARQNAVWNGMMQAMERTHRIATISQYSQPWRD